MTRPIAIASAVPEALKDFERDTEVIVPFDLAVEFAPEPVPPLTAVLKLPPAPAPELPPPGTTLAEADAPDTSAPALAFVVPLVVATAAAALVELVAPFGTKVEVEVLAKSSPMLQLDVAVPSPAIVVPVWQNLLPSDISVRELESEPPP